MTMNEIIMQLVMLEEHPAMPKGFQPTFQKVIEAISDMPEIIRCKDCVHRTDPQKCPMCYEEWYEIDEGDGYMDNDYILHDNTEDNGYCHKGELRGDSE